MAVGLPFRISPGWRSVDTLLDFRVPVGIAPSGTIGPGGTLSLGTALVSSDAPGSNDVHRWLYLYFPANAVKSGSQAGFYLTQMTAANAGTVYQDRYYATTDEQPLVPISPTPVTGGYGSATAYTGVGTSISGVVKYRVPGNTFRDNSWMTLSYTATNNSSADTKGIVVSFGTKTAVAANATTNVIIHSEAEILKMVGHQGFVSRAFAHVSASSYNGYIQDVDFSQDQLVTVDLVLNSATDYILLESVLIYGVLGV